MGQRYYYNIGKDKILVPKKAYEELIKSDNKMRYFEYDLKVEKVVIKDGEEVIRPSREDSFDRLQERHMQFSDTSENLEEDVLARSTRRKLYAGIKRLPESERELVMAIYFGGYSERDMAKRREISQVAIHKQKVKVLEKLKRFMEV